MAEGVHAQCIGCRNMGPCEVRNAYGHPVFLCIKSCAKAVFYPPEGTNLEHLDNRGRLNGRRGR